MIRIVALSTGGQNLHPTDLELKQFYRSDLYRIARDIASNIYAKVVSLV
jgi:hypothetical protein